MLRIGHGYDSHRLVPNRALKLGGIEIPFPLGLDGHSDADVLLHAIMDAVLGAMALGDIGHWFPPTDPAFKNADSMLLLKSILESEKLKDWTLVNLDATIMAERPRLRPHIDKMRSRIADAFRVTDSAVSIKATTNEGMDAVGRGDGIAAHCVILMTSQIHLNP